MARATTIVRDRRTAVAARLVIVAVVTLVGVGACAFGTRDDHGGAAGLEPVSVAEGATGASAAPTPDQARPSQVPTAPAPTTSPAVGKTTTPPRTASGCPEGEHQRDVEKHLAELGGFGRIIVDGRQSAADCAAIKRFQRRYGIWPAQGRAGPTTASVARRLASTDTERCRARTGTTICVNLTLQTVWVMREGRVVMAPTVTRTGMSGFATPAGTFSISARNIKEWSNPYEVWLPYWQHFSRGMGFHQTTTYLHDGSIGSHGCINLLPVDARRLWDLGRIGTRVYLFGRRPGT